MEKSRPKILVKDVQSKQILFECALTESEKAYQFAAEMEEMGLDLEVIIPTLGETLSNSLGHSKEELAQYKESLEEEMDSHEGSCCFTDEEKKTIH